MKGGGGGRRPYPPSLPHSWAMAQKYGCQSQRSQSGYSGWCATAPGPTWPRHSHATPAPTHTGPPTQPLTAPRGAPPRTHATLQQAGCAGHMQVHILRRSAGIDGGGGGHGRWRARRHQPTPLHTHRARACEHAERQRPASSSFAHFGRPHGAGPGSHARPPSTAAATTLRGAARQPGWARTPRRTPHHPRAREREHAASARLGLTCPHAPAQTAGASPPGTARTRR
jgi:hypothetical protein